MNIADQTEPGEDKGVNLSSNRWPPWECLLCSIVVESRALAKRCLVWAFLYEEELSFDRYIQLKGLITSDMPGHPTGAGTLPAEHSLIVESPLLTTKHSLR